jgi:hypothetical protein
MGGQACLAALPAPRAPGLAEEVAEPMMTTDRRIPIDAFGSDPAELVHLTGSFQVLARVTPGRSDDLPTHVEVCFDAARVRGVGLKSGARYAARGAYRFSDDLPELPVPVHLISAFELLRHGSGDLPPTRLLLVVPFQVTVQTDGRVVAGMEGPMLVPCPGGLA